MKSFEANPRAQRRPSRLDRPDAGIHRSRANLFVSVFVCTGVCFSHCLCLYAFLLMAFSSVSPTLAIFCLVAPNVPLCLSAVTTQLIYIYLQIQEMTAENYTYFKRRKLYISCYLLWMWFSVFVCAIHLRRSVTQHMLRLIRCAVKSASRNMTNAFGKITSAVWIRSLRQMTVNDTGGNFPRRRWRAILCQQGVRTGKLEQNRG